MSERTATVSPVLPHHFTSWPMLGARIDSLPMRRPSSPCGKSRASVTCSCIEVLEREEHSMRGRVSSSSTRSYTLEEAVTTLAGES